MNAKKIIAITAVSLVILAETGVLQVATEKLEVFRKRLQKKYAAKEQELAQKMNEQKSQPVKVPITIGDTTLGDLAVPLEQPTKRPYVDADGWSDHMSKKDFILCCIGFICASVGLLLYMAYKMIFLLG